MIVAARWLRHTFSGQRALVKAHKIDDDDDDDDDDNVVNGVDHCLSPLHICSLKNHSIHSKKTYTRHWIRI